jgi:hypothetical protein
LCFKCHKKGAPCPPMPWAEGQGAGRHT